MQRRRLLTGLLLAAAVPSQALAGFAGAATARFRWTPDGRVFRRTSTGWTESLHLGAGFEILTIDESRPEARLVARHSQRPFELRSLDGRCWRTPRSNSRTPSSPSTVG